jgi:dephospho-CoA kinase
MFKIAVTGGIACGKSLVGRFLADAGVAVRDADEMAHELMAPGQAVARQVVEVFGPDILDGDGRIDRRRLGNRVFSAPEDLKRLNAIVHPAVKRVWQEWLAGQPDTREAAAVIVPLLYEAGEGEGWDAVVCVVASEAVQMERLAGRGLSEGESRKRLAAQMPVSRKAVQADYVIVNNGTETVLNEQTRRVLRCIMETRA